MRSALSTIPLDFAGIAVAYGFDVRRLLAIRHTARDPTLNRALPWLAEERADLWLSYQRIQWPIAERSMRRAEIVAGFIGLAPGEATFAGLHRVGSSRELAAAEYADFPGNAELMTLGMQSDGRERMLAFDLEPLEEGRALIGRLTVGWSAGRTWVRWVDRNAFPVIELARDSLFVRPLPDWRDLTLNWSELTSLPRSWTAALAQWRGVYLIFDEERARGYVGSASGAENILGRWREYARTGHGGNVGLRSSRPESLRFSILERTSPDMEPADVVRLENSWKLRLGTRHCGLNAN